MLKYRLIFLFLTFISYLFFNIDMVYFQYRRRLDISTEILMIKKLLLPLSLIVLDVAVFPTSCSRRSSYAVFIGNYSTAYDKVFDEEDYYDFYQAVHISAKNKVIEIPKTLPESKEYQIKSWYLLDSNHELAKEVTFPYFYTDSDYIDYYRGYRHSIIFCSIWEKTV